MISRFALRRQGKSKNFFGDEIMRRKFHLAVVLSLMFIGAGTKIQAQPALQNQFDAAFDQFVLAAMNTAQTPGAAVAIVKGDQVIYRKGYGVTSIENPIPITPDTLFRLGSTTKMFTAAALVQLAEEGKLKLDAPLGDYVRGLAPKLAQVNVHQLLSHTAGLRDFAATEKSQDDAVLATMIRAWKDDVFFGEPGKIYSYSSAGYWLAGLVLEEITKSAYADAMKQRLFTPLGMQRTTFRPLEALTYPLSIGHKLENGHPVIIRPAFNNNAMWPAGSIYSSVNDLARFALAFLNEGRVAGVVRLKPSLITKLSRAHINLPFETESHHGYGLMLYRLRGVRLASHGGFSTGYGSMMYFAPDQRVAVIVLTNKSGETLHQVGQKALAMLLPLGPAEPLTNETAQGLTEAELAQCPGKYSHPPQIFAVMAKNKQLIFKQDQEEYKLKKIGSFAFTYGDKEQNFIVFVPNQAGHIEHSFNGMYAYRKIE
jgi:CubicO group peptidase (beta-lactamase class C family)